MAEKRRKNTAMRARGLSLRSCYMQSPIKEVYISFCGTLMRLARDCENWQGGNKREEENRTKETMKILRKYLKIWGKCDIIFEMKS